MYPALHVKDGLLYRRALAYLVTVVIVLYVAFRKYSRDRVILCEALGVGIFAVGILICAMVRFSRMVFLGSGITAVLFGVLAVCFGVAQRVQHKKRRIGFK